MVGLGFRITTTLRPAGNGQRKGIAGGQLAGGNGSPSTELYLLAPRIFAFAENMLVGRHGHTATLLRDGTVLLAGGWSTWPEPTSSAEIYTPAVH